MELVCQLVSCEDINQTDNSGCEPVIAERPTYVWKRLIKNPTSWKLYA